ncbi:MAG TPA: phosphoribosylanthranilate isomerase [Steroidobacteraceae bacterium]|nr:phosphoribosylanthranilate isomerase [Steroidobacteraceae bacterium]
MAGWIKICGMTTPAAVAAAVAAGVDAIGFVFAPSVRALSPERASELAAPARGRVNCVAVTLHPSQAEVNRILEVFRPDILQSDAQDLLLLALPKTLALLPVWRPDVRLRGGLPTQLLYEGAQSGTGTLSNWQEAHELARKTRVVLAGGLTAGNVSTAIRAVQPFGVDTSSGVEHSPGLKDPAKIREFVDAARAAFDRKVA